MMTGVWELVEVQLKESESMQKFDDIKGVLIYTPDQFFSVSLKLSSNLKTKYPSSLIPNYYSVGKYEISEDKILETNMIHALDQRMGEKRAVRFTLKGQTLTQFFEFEQSRSSINMIWKKSVIQKVPGPE